MRKEMLLPGVAVLFGAAGLLLRRMELAVVFDPETGLAAPGHPLTLGLMGLSLAAVLVLALLCRGSKGQFDGGYHQAFGHKGLGRYIMVVLSAVCMLGGAVVGIVRFVTGLGMEQTPSITQFLLSVLALAGGGALFLIGQKNFGGKDWGKFSFTLLVPAYTCCMWLLAAYQSRAGDPVVLDYVYLLFAIISSLLALYFTAGFAFQHGKVFRTGFLSLTAIYFCMVALADLSDLLSWLFCLSMLLYLLSNVPVLFYRLKHPITYATEVTTDEQEA